MNAPTNKTPATSPLFDEDELGLICMFVLLLADKDLNTNTALSLLGAVQDDWAVKLHDRMVSNICEATEYHNSSGTPTVARPEGIVKVAPSFKTFVELLPQMNLVPADLVEQLEAIMLIALNQFFADKVEAARLHTK